MEIKINKVCSIENCNNTVWSSGLCNKHRQRKQRGRLGVKTWADKNDYEVNGDITYIVLRNRSGDIVAKTVIDTCNKDICESKKWYYRSDGYAASSGMRTQEGILLHHFIYGTKTLLDHANRDRLDNRLSNLRAVTAQQNILNSGVRKDNLLGHKGVHSYMCKNIIKYYATLNVNGIKYRSKSFTVLDDAIEARKTLESNYHAPLWK